MEYEIHPDVLYYVRQMLDLPTAHTLPPTQHVPEDLLKRLERVSQLCRRAHGDLKSRQVIAMIIEQWERDSA